jgi:hypothetical protein
LGVVGRRFPRAEIVAGSESRCYNAPAQISLVPCAAHFPVIHEDRKVSMRRPWVRLLLIVLAVLFVYMLLVGLGLTGHKRGKIPKRVLVMNDFEDPSNDLQWFSGGYVLMETSTENLTHARRSAQATFLLARQFFPTPTPGMLWQPSLKLSHHSVTPLEVEDWTGYDTLNLDVYNPADAPVSAMLTVTDAKGFEYASPLLFLPKKVTNAAVSLSLLKKERLDLTSVDSLTLIPDVSASAEPVELYLDYLRLEGEPIVPQKKKK